MFSLQDLLGQQQGTEAVDQISSQIGANPTVTNMAIQMALPMLLNGLANNAQQVSQKSGMDIGQVAQLLITLAPIVMGFLGKKKQEQNLDANGLQNMLGEQQQTMQSSGNPMMDMVSGMLDRDKDGSSMDDLAGMAMSYFQKR